MIPYVANLKYIFFPAVLLITRIFNSQLHYIATLELPHGIKTPHIFGLRGCARLSVAAPTYQSVDSPFSEPARSFDVEPRVPPCILCRGSVYKARKKKTYFLFPGRRGRR